MGLTGHRHIGLAGCTIGAITLDDCIGATIQTGSQVIASTAEGKKFANAFVDGVQKQRTLTIQSYDLAAAISVDGTRHMKGTSLSFTILKSTESSGASDIPVGSSSPNAYCSNLNFAVSQDQETIAELSFLFKSPSGTSHGLSLS